MPASTDDKTYVSGKNGNDDLRATNDKDGSYIHANGGNDTLRGGRYDDILDGGAGDDLYAGGGGADQFRFFGNQIEGQSDTDRVFDLNFDEGDTLVFGNYTANTFFDRTGENAFANGQSAIISSVEGLKNAVNDSSLITAERRGNTDTLILTIQVDGKTHNIQLTGIYSAFVAAGGQIGDGDIISA